MEVALCMLLVGLSVGAIGTWLAVGRESGSQPDADWWDEQMGFRVSHLDAAQLALSQGDAQHAEMEMRLARQGSEAISELRGVDNPFGRGDDLLVEALCRMQTYTTRSS